MSQTPPPTVLRLAICLYPVIAAIDVIGPVEILSFLHSDTLNRFRSYLPEGSRFALEMTYLSYTLDPIMPASMGPRFLPERTYDEFNDSNNHEQFDLLLIPGGPGARPGTGNVRPSLIKFIQSQAPKAKYILTVCTGSWILADTGLLDGKKATTNKFALRQCKEATSNEVKWVIKARWVVDGNIWTSSGATAGIDMAYAFLEHLAGENVARFARNVLELNIKGEGDDEFAAIHGLDIFE